MASGEYLSMQAQRELFERELAVERRALEESPEHELSELADIYRSKGITPDLAEDLARSMMRSPELALETHAREELGIDPTAIGSAWRASWVSFVTFALGALLPLLPWLWSSGRAAVVGSVVIGVVAAFSVGATLGRFTGRSKIRSGLRQTAVAALAASVTYGVGGLVGT
jgi:VIT1/CCC1 family predicted Fe2+/Mn2+ transporter